MSISDNLMKARCRLITVEPWYGTMASLIKWKCDNFNTKTMGVRMVRNGEIEGIYNEDFCAELGTDQMMAVVTHEIEHIVRLHITRCGEDRIPLQWNVAADMIVNGKKGQKRIENLPTIHDKDPVFMLEDIKDDATTEEIYDHISEHHIKINITCPICGGSGKGQKGKGKGKGKDKKEEGGGQGDQGDPADGQGGQGDGAEHKPGEDGEGGDEPCPMCGNGGDGGSGSAKITGTWMDDHSIWKSSTVSKDEARQVVKDMVNQATAKACGNTPGHLVDAIKALDKPVINWKNQFRQMVGRKAGGHRNTFSRRSRRHNHFGIPGKSSHASIPLTVCTDTSGSMSDHDLEKIYTEIESMSQRFKITLIQFDHGVQGLPQKYHRGDWRKIKILGRGGTSFIDLIEWMKEHKQVGQVNIILTDGCAPWPEPEDFFVLWVIVGNADHIESIKPPWGEVIRVEK